MAYEEPQWTAWKAYLDSLFEPGGAGDEAIGRYCVDPSERIVRRLFWRDDMENYTVCRWRPIGANGIVRYVNAAIAPSPYDHIPSFEGDYILEVYDPTTDLAGAQLRLALGRLSLEQKVALEFRWLKQLSTPQVRSFIIEQNFGIPTETNVLNTLVLYQFDTQRWMIRDSAGNMINVGQELGLSSGVWNYLKIVIDLQNRRYDKLISNGLTFDLTEAVRLVDYGTPWGVWQPLLYHDTAHPGDQFYYDDVRLYLNEV